MSVNMNKPVAWGAFKKLSKTLQEGYIQRLVEQYAVNATSLAVMFDVHPATVRRYITDSELDVRFPAGRSMSADQRSAWERFLQGEVEKPAEVDSDATTQEARSAKMEVKELSISFAGAIDAAMIFNTITQMIGRNAVGQVKIVCTLA